MRNVGDDIKDIKWCLLLTRGLIILIMKADNELALSLPVLFKSVQKSKYSRLPITRAFKGTRKKFELSGARRK